MNMTNMKDDFNKKLKDYIGQRKDVTREYFTEDRYNQILNEVKKAKLLREDKLPLTAKQYNRLKRYDVITIDGSEKLIKVDPQSSSKDVRYFCKVDELFDILNDAHLSTGHKGTRAMEIIIGKKYCNVTRAAIRMYLMVCTACKEIYNTTPSENTERTEGENTSQTQDSSQDNSKESDTPEEPNRNVEEPLAEELNQKEQEEPVMKKRRTTYDNDPIVQNALHCMKMLLATSTKRDEHSVFGEHVAYRIRNSNRNDVEITVAQHHIENIIYNLFTGVYNDAKGTSFQTIIVPKMELDL